MGCMFYFVCYGFVTLGNVYYTRSMVLKMFSGMMLHDEVDLYPMTIVVFMYYNSVFVLYL